MLAAAAAALITASAASAQTEPLWAFMPIPPTGAVIAAKIAKGDPEPIKPPPYGTLYGPCGAAVDEAGNFYISDHYRDTVDIWEPNANYAGKGKSRPLGETGYITQIPYAGDGPCGLAFDGSGNIYVYGFHHSVTKFGPMPSFGPGVEFSMTGEDLAHHLPTGLDVERTTGDVYVDRRTYVAVYDSNGAPVIDGLAPLKIGEGSLQDGYGVAVSRYPGTFGRIYVPDAGSDTVKVYDPQVDKDNPVEVIDGSALPKGGFTSLRDSAVAIDRVSGDIYVADDTRPQHSECGEATIQIFDAAGVYEGHLEFQVCDAYAPGLAVDNSPTPRWPEGHQGRVYVTSGNTDGAAIYAYPPGAATTATPIPSPAVLETRAIGAGAIVSDAGGAVCEATCEEPVPAGVEVGLTAEPSPGAKFIEWTGACSGLEPTCFVGLDAATSVGAIFTDPSSTHGGETPEAALGPSLGPADPLASGPAPAAGHRRRHSKHRRHHVRHRHRHRRS